MKDKSTGPSKSSLRGLDFLNLFLADVRDGVGPYLSAYLKGSQHWQSGEIGLALSASAVATVVAQTPAGALVDRLNQKRTLIVLAAAFVTVGCIGIAVLPKLPVVVGCQILIGVAAALFPPAVAALTLGLVGRSKLDRRVGRNETFNHSGNVLAATLAGLIGKFIAPKGIFFLVGAMAAASAVAVRTIRYKEIDQELARGDGDEEDLGEEDKAQDEHHSSNLVKLFSDRRILLFCGAVVLFHFANAAMLPLVGQRLAKGHAEDSTLYLSACIIVAQLVMVPTANLVGRLAEGGRKPIFLVGFGVLPIRGVLYTLNTNPYYLVSIQILDGVAGGIFGVLSVLVIADLTKGTGRFNLTQGALNTAIGIGAGLSNLVAGYVVQYAGYNAGFLMLAAIAAVATGVFWFFVPESKNEKENKQSVKPEVGNA